MQLRPPHEAAAQSCVLIPQGLSVELAVEKRERTEVAVEKCD